MAHTDRASRVGVVDRALRTRTVASCVLVLFAFAVLVARPVNAELASKTWGVALIPAKTAQVELNANLEGDTEYILRFTYDLEYGAVLPGDFAKVMSEVITQTREAVFDKGRAPIYIRVVVDDEVCGPPGYHLFRPCRYTGVVEVHLYSPGGLIVVTATTLTLIIKAVALLLSALAYLVVYSMLGLIGLKVVELLAGGGELGIFAIIAIAGIALVLLLKRRR